MKEVFALLFILFLSLDSFAIEESDINKTIKLCQSNQEQ